MTTYNTGNPVGSSDPRDLYDNAQNFDTASVSDDPTFVDRLGNTRLTIKGMVDAATTGNPAVGAAQGALASADRAEAQADRAEAQADRAELEVAEGINSGVSQVTDFATAEADRAEAAAGAAFVNADVYPDVASGLAAVADGEQFQVLSADGTEYIRYRRDSASVATEVARYTAPVGIPVVEMTGQTQIVPPNVQEDVGPGINASSNYVSSGYRSMVLPVVPGETLSMWNDQESYTDDAGYGHAFYSGKPISNENRVQGTTVSIKTSGIYTYNSVIVPEGARYLVANTYFSGGDFAIDWNIVRNAPYNGETKADYKPVVARVNDGTTWDNDLRNSFTLEREGNLYVKDELERAYLNPEGNRQPTALDWFIWRLPVAPGKTYTINIGSTPTTFPFKMRYYEGGVNIGSVYTTRNLSPVEGDLTFTVPADSVATHMVMNVRVYNGTSFFLDMSDTLIAARGTSTEGVSSSWLALGGILGYPLVKGSQSADYEPGTSRLSGKGKFLCFGDSITQGTEGGYVKYLSEAFLFDVENYGSSGAKANRLVNIITDTPRRDSATYTFNGSDYSDVSAISIMIGTNDSTGSYFGDIANNPTGHVQEYSVADDYWALFPNDYTGNISLCIEYVKWKNPEIEIHLITPPYMDRVDGPSHTEKLIPHLEAIAKYYSVHLIYATYESGLSYKGMNADYGPYSYDGTHLTALGNKVFGRYLAQKILSFG